MAELLRPSRSRATSVRTRSRSRPSRATSPELHRAFSHLDDQGIYHPDHELERREDDAEPVETILEPSSPSDSSSLSSSEASLHEKAKAECLEEVPEVRDGVLDEHDLESGPAPLEKIETEPPEDPNLVSWEGPEDPENPKNCKPH